MDQENMMLSETSQRVLYDIAYTRDLNKQIYRYRRQTSGYKWGDRSGEGQIRDMGLREADYLYKLDKQ